MAPSACPVFGTKGQVARISKREHSFLVLQGIIRGLPAGLMYKQAFLQDWKFRHRLVRTRVESFPHASVYLPSNLAPRPSGLTNDTLRCISFISLSFLQEPPQWGLCFRLMLSRASCLQFWPLGCGSQHSDALLLPSEQNPAPAMGCTESFVT